MNLEKQDADEDAAVSKKNAASSSKSEFQINATTRLQRNQAEKQRRDRLNGYVTELATLVPMVKNASKPLDKVSILRLTAAHMRLNLSCLNPKKFKGDIPQLPASFVSQLEAVEKSLGGFIVATTFAGQVAFCSKSIENFTGYHDIDIIGQPIFNYVHDKEVSFFERKISSIVSLYKKKNNKKISKIVKMHMRQRPLPRTNDTKYQKMTFKLTVHCNEIPGAKEKDNKSNDKKKKRGSKDFGTNAVILMFVQPSVEPNINLLLVSQDVYYTIHGLQGEIMFADQRISTITGYLAHEVKGTSAYSYIFESDVPIALFAQKAMFSSNDGIGLITYRLKIFGSQFIYLQSKGRIVYKESSTEVSHFVCYNRCLSDEEGSRELKKFQERFAPQIDKVEDKESKESTVTTKSFPVSPLSNANSNINEVDLSNSSSLNPVQLPNNNSCHEGLNKVKMNGNSPNENMTSNQNFYDTNELCSKQMEMNGSVESSLLSVLFSNYPKGVTPVEFVNTQTYVMENSQETDLPLSSSPLTSEKNIYQLDNNASSVFQRKHDIFPQDTFNNLNSSDLIFKNNVSSNSSVYPHSLENEKRANMRLVNPTVENEECNFFSNGFSNVSNAQDMNQFIVQQRKQHSDSSFACETISENYNNFEPMQESFLSKLNYYPTESLAPDKTCFKSRCDSKVLSNPHDLDHKAMYRSNSASYSHPIEYLHERNETSGFDFNPSIPTQPCSQNNAYSNQHPSLRNDYLNGYYQKSNSLDMFSDCNSINGPSSKFWSEAANSRPAQPNHNMYCEQLLSECTSIVNDQLLPAGRKTLANGHKLYDEKTKCHGPNLVQKLCESHLKVDTFDLLSREQTLENNARFLDQCQTQQPLVKNSSHTENGVVNFNCELYNELDACFAKLPSSVCSLDSLDISVPQNWNVNDQETAKLFSPEAIVNGFNDHMDFTVMR